MTGGVSQLKYQLAKTPEHDVGICNKSIAERDVGIYNNQLQKLCILPMTLLMKRVKREKATANKTKLAAGGVARSSRTTSRSRT